MQEPKTSGRPEFAILTPRQTRSEKMQNLLGALKKSGFRVSQEAEQELMKRVQPEV